MPRETKEERVAQIQTRGYILVAVISASVTLIVGLITAFFAFAPFQEWVQSWGNETKTQALPIEQIPQQIFGYADTDAWGVFWLIYENTNDVTYRFDYWLPTDQSAYAGLAFQFLDGANISSYEAVECVIMFSQLPDAVDLYFKDIAGNFNTIRVTNSNTREMVLRYEFTNFPGINFNAVKEFGIIADTAFSTGAHQVRIKHVRFTK